MENEVIKTLVERRSVRRYTKKQVEEEKLQLILKAGTYAPTGMGSQSPVMVVVQDPKTISLLSRLNAKAMGSSGDPFYGAPTVVIVLADKNMWTCVEDGSLVMGNLMNAAFSLGVDSCWIHRAKEVMYQPEWVEWIKSLGLEGEYEGIGNLVVGYPEGDMPAKKERREGRVVYVD